jgi:hypothetical protein
MNTTIDINILPKDAQNELRDFYEFLVKKYVRKATRQKDEDKTQKDSKKEGLKDLLNISVWPEDNISLIEKASQNFNSWPIQNF